jgi:replication-associated recombination protein RarA
VGGEHGHLLLRHGLHDVVNVDPLAARMRPKAVVDLIGFDELACNARRTPEKRSKLCGFLL